MQHSATWNPGMTMDHMQKAVIFNALAFYKDKLVAANSLGIPLKKLEKKLEEYNTERETKEALEAMRRKNQEEFSLRYRGIGTGANISK